MLAKEFWACFLVRDADKVPLSFTSPSAGEGWRYQTTTLQHMRLFGSSEVAMDAIYAARIPGEIEVRRVTLVVSDTVDGRHEP